MVKNMLTETQRLIMEHLSVQRLIGLLHAAKVNNLLQKNLIRDLEDLTLEFEAKLKIADEQLEKTQQKLEDANMTIAKYEHDYIMIKAPKVRLRDLGSGGCFVYDNL
jgi:hypothetical protein